MTNTGCAGVSATATRTGCAGALAAATRTGCAGVPAGIRREAPVLRKPTLLLAALPLLFVALAVSAQGGVSYERLEAAADEPGNWLMYSGQFNSQRFSRIDEIDSSNAADLELRWVRQLPTLGRVETTPLVIDEAGIDDLADRFGAALEDTEDWVRENGPD